MTAPSAERQFNQAANEGRFCTNLGNLSAVAVVTAARQN